VLGVHQVVACRHQRRATGADTLKWADFGVSPGRNAHTDLRAQRQRSAREGGRQVECPYGVAGKASTLVAGVIYRHRRILGLASALFVGHVWWFDGVSVNEAA
jgi:hypothetical protein